MTASAPVLAAHSTLSVPAERVIRSWGTQSGLPQNTVNAVLQTRNGYLWVATRDGLARFDGVRFTTFGLPEGMQSVDVSALYEDRYGTLWIGTIGGGLSRWRDNKIETLNPSDSQVGFSISSLAEDFTGRLWVGTDAGVLFCIGGRLMENEAMASVGRIPIRALLCDREGAMWIATANQGLFRAQKGHLEAQPGPEGNEKILAYCLLEDRQGRIWASVGNGKVLCREQGGWATFSQTDGLPFAYVTCLAEDADGTVWAGSLDAGLYSFSAGRFSPIQRKDGLSADDVRCLGPDREGNLWVGTRTGGLNRLSKPRLLHCGAAQGLTNEFTRSVAEDARGRLWVATIGGGLYTGTPEGFASFSEDPLIRFYPQTESVLSARDASLWWGGARALLRWREGRLTGCYTNESWVQSAAITALCEDGRGGLWIGNSQSKLVRYFEDRFTTVAEPIARGPITALAAEPGGALWVGSVAGGLVRMEGLGQGTVTPTRGLLSHSIRTVYLDKDGSVWIGTAGGGLSWWRNGQVHNFTAQQGLDAQTISQVVEDDFGGLWLGCSRGIIRVRKAELQQLAAGQISFLHPKVFGLNEGMPAEECSGGFCPAGLKTRTGLVCFSTVRGLVFLDPRLQETNSPAPNVLLEEVLADGAAQPLKARVQRETDLETAPSRSVLIAAGARELELHYTGINLASPERVGFRYRMDGFDPDWNEAGGRRTAYYHRLAPGDYTFRVIACNTDGVWNEEGAALGITVLPFFWQRAWFVPVLSLAIIGGLAGLLRMFIQRRFRRRLAQLETRHAVDQERFRIAQDMHDHLGGMLTQISQLTDLAQGQTPEARPPAQQFERIGRHARAAVQALDEIVWATNPRNDTLPRFAEYVSSFADSFFEETQVRCWQEVPVDLPEVPLRSDFRHNLFMAIRETLTNVLKHSRATEVWLRIEFKGSELAVQIEDNGCGFAVLATSAGNGLQNVRARLLSYGGTAEVTSSPGKGTKVQLTLKLETAATGPQPESDLR